VKYKENFHHNPRKKERGGMRGFIQASLISVQISGQQKRKPSVSERAF
jgi:hypothetical protein